MKKMIAMMMALMLMVTAALPAMAEYLSFTQRNFYGGQTLAVYQGPGTEYGRDGWAKASTDEPLYAAGQENGWAMVMYSLNDGSSRVGWVDLSQFKYNTKQLKLDNLYFEYRTAQISSLCSLTDDPVLFSRETARLNAGTRVTYLGSFYKYRNWAYVETWVSGHPVRGFVPMECISLN